MDDLVALYFKVPHDFRCWLKTEAAIRNVTMTELLMTALLSYVEAESTRGPVANPYLPRISRQPLADS
jgi:hypothetical protein